MMSNFGRGAATSVQSELHKWYGLGLQWAVPLRCASAWIAVTPIPSFRSCFLHAAFLHMYAAGMTTVRCALSCSATRTARTITPTRCGFREGSIASSDSAKGARGRARILLARRRTTKLAIIVRSGDWGCQDMGLGIRRSWPATEAVTAFAFVPAAASLITPRPGHPQLSSAAWGGFPPAHRINCDGKQLKGRDAQDKKSCRQGAGKNSARCAPGISALPAW